MTTATHTTDAHGPASRRDRRTARTRRALVTAAQELFEERGFAETTVDDIAERADVAPRTFFRYFATKEAVLFADFEELHDDLLERLAARPAGEAPFVSLVEALREHAALLQPRLGAIVRSVELAEACAPGGTEPVLMRARMLADIAETLARRLATTVEAEPRAQVCAAVVGACFGGALKIVVRDGGNLEAAFLRLVDEVAADLGAAAPHVPPG